MNWLERFRDAHPEGYEVWSWYSGYRLPHWQAGVWVSLDRWALGVETEVDPGGFWDDAEHRRFFDLSLGPAHFILTRIKRSRYAA